MDIEKAKSDALFLRTELGHGKYGDEEVSISLATNGAVFLVEFEDEKYLVKTQSIVEDVIKFRKKLKGKKDDKN